jgi:homoserine O-succinyltransferase
LLKEYKREVMRFYHGERTDYPPFPEHYFNEIVQQIFLAYEQHVKSVKHSDKLLDEFPEAQILEHIDNTWKDTAKAVFNNWLGKIYQLTNQDRRFPFMEGVDPNNPLGL